MSIKPLVNGSVQELIRRLQLRSLSSFTLAEVLIAVTILGLLATCASP